MLEKAVQSAIYEKALKNHYIEILYIDFEDTGKCIKLHQDTKLLSGENIFPESDEQMFEDYICEKIMRYASGDTEDLNRVKQQMTMEAITKGKCRYKECFSVCGGLYRSTAAGRCPSDCACFC
ncbi:MAG TPA: hypothetical protein DHW25_09510 [Blautia sp.]|nr:hypothetical protein [Blautia sp.]